jgi:hypothetical protein
VIEKLKSPARSRVVPIGLDFEMERFSAVPKIARPDQRERLLIVVAPWGLTFRFLKQLVVCLWSFAPLLTVLVLVILFLGYLTGKEEGWSRFDSFYWAFVTATTVGYGDLRPTKRKSRIIAILIAVLGLLTTGIIIALGVLSATNAWNRT